MSVVMRTALTRRATGSYQTLVPMRHPERGWAVYCVRCAWRGYRRGLQCECYDENAWYCRPWAPGTGCPSGILWPCPRCAWPNDVTRIPRRHVVYSCPGETRAWWWFRW